MTIQIVRDSEGDLYLKCATELLPNAIGHLDGDIGILYLNDGKTYEFEFMCTDKWKFSWDIDRKINNLYESINSNNFGVPLKIPSHSSGKYYLHDDIKRKLLFIYENQHTMIKDINGDNFDLNKHKNIGFSILAELFLNRVDFNDKLQGKNIYSYYLWPTDIFNCLTIPYFDIFIHYAVSEDVHYHVVNDCEKLHERHFSELTKCVYLNHECDYCPSTFMKISSVKSARS